MAASFTRPQWTWTHPWPVLSITAATETRRVTRLKYMQTTNAHISSDTMQVIGTISNSGGFSLQYLGGGHGPMANAVARAYNWGLKAEPPVVYRGRAPDQRARSPLIRGQKWAKSALEAGALLAFGRSMEATNVAIFLKFRNANKLDICVIFAKNHEWQRN